MEITNKNKVNKIYFSISKNNTDLENFDGLNFNETGLNVNAPFVFDERSNDGRHVYIITSNINNSPFDRFFNFRIREMCKVLEEKIIQHSINYVALEDIFFEKGKFKAFQGLFWQDNSQM